LNRTNGKGNGDSRSSGNELFQWFATIKRKNSGHHDLTPVGIVLVRGWSAPRELKTASLTGQKEKTKKGWSG
jgi:hypothetical protein